MQHSEAGHHAGCHNGIPLQMISDQARPTGVLQEVRRSMCIHAACLKSKQFLRSNQFSAGDQSAQAMATLVKEVSQVKNANDVKQSYAYGTVVIS
jgi:hypothetical protein